MMGMYSAVPDLFPRCGSFVHPRAAEWDAVCAVHEGGVGHQDPALQVGLDA